MHHSLSKISSMFLTLPPTLVQSEACTPFLLSPSSFGHERRETSAAPLPRRNLDLQTICIRHLVPLGVRMCCQGALWLGDTEKTGILPLLKASGPSSIPQPLLLCALSACGTRGQSTLLVVIVWGGIFRRIIKTNRRNQEFKDIFKYLFIIMIPLMISWASCTAFPH